MDDARCLVTLDIGGRPWLVYEAAFTNLRIGDVPTEMIFHFFKSLADAAQVNLHIVAKGNNDHHVAEAMFKGVAKALKMAVRQEMFNYELPTTKGVL
jgi:imidazoleglycerol-phosphate dehydratase/histidinol-phosphatase